MMQLGSAHIVGVSQLNPPSLDSKGLASVHKKSEKKVKDPIGKTRFVQKLLDGKVEDVTLDDVQALAQELYQADESSSIEKQSSSQSPRAGILIRWDAFRGCMMEVLDTTDIELDAIEERIVLTDGSVTPQVLYQCLCQASVRALLKQIRNDYVARRSTVDPEFDKTVSRNWFVDRVTCEVQRDDAFGTLPVTSVYMIVFMFLVIYHLQIWNRQELERGLEEWVIGTAEEYYGPFILNHVNDADSFFKYMTKSGNSAVFGTERRMPGAMPRLRQLRIASSSYLVGDAFLTQTKYPEENQEVEWMLLSPIGRKTLHAHENVSGAALMAADAQIKHLISSQWFDDDTSDLLLSFATYSERAEMYALVEINVPLGNYGYVKPRVTATAVLVHPYPNIWVVSLDVLYILLILYPLYVEVKDMWHSMRLGFGEFLDYWSFWNVVDWSAIIMGFVNIVIWCMGMNKMNAACLHDLVTSDGKLQSRSVSLTQSQNEEIHDALQDIISLFFWLHMCVAVTTISIVLKFFKAFQANPRLHVVTRTLTSAAVDILHFFIVFFTIFLSFAIIGHVLFGSDLVQFYTLASSVNTGVTVLMGEFGWYVDLGDSRDLLPSGTPRFLLTLWYMIYMFFVLLVLVNILLAVILKRYADVSSVIEGNEKFAPTLWKQFYRYLQRKEETKGFVPLSLIEKDLLNDARPGHPTEIVTHSSLLEAFPRMKEPQASWIMNFLQQELMHKQEEEQEDETTSRLKRTERFVQRIAEELHLVTLSMSECKARLCSLEGNMSDDLDMRFSGTGRDGNMPETPRSNKDSFAPSMLSNN